MHKCIHGALRPLCAVLIPRPNPGLLPTRCSRTIKTTARRLAIAPGPNKDQNAGSSPPSGDSPPKPPSMEDVLAGMDPKDNPLLAPVHIPDDANAVLKPEHPAADILSQSGIVVQRQIELANLLVGFEQANRYVILDPHGNHLGFMAEHDGGIGKAMSRQWFKTHRAFTTHVFDRYAKEVLRFHRPFSWIKTRIRVYDPLVPVGAEANPQTSAVVTREPDLTAMQQLSDLPMEQMRVIGEAHSEWAPLRRKYNLFLSHYPVLDELGPGAMGSTSVTDLSNMQRYQSAQLHGATGAVEFTQFAAIDEPFLSWDFNLLDENGRLIGSINRGFRGFAREIFTDTGSYMLRMDAAGADEDPQKHTPTGPAYTEVLGGRGGSYGLTLDQRAVMLATAVNIDYDYFSRHSGHGGFIFPVWLGGGGGEAAGAGAGAAGAAGAGEAAGAAVGAGDAVGGAVVGGAGRAVGSAAGGMGAGEGAIAGAGTMAGYEAMQRGVGRGPRAPEPEPAPEVSPHEQPYGEPYDPYNPRAPPPEANPQEPPYGEPYDPQSPQSGFDGPNEGGDVWGSNDADPWSGGSGAGESGGGEGGGALQKLWDAFFGD
ncbi:hypothetical protein ABEF95_001722 [Exophiala dermatitidis]